jgi:hypothetical protein
VLSRHSRGFSTASRRNSFPMEVFMKSFVFELVITSDGVATTPRLPTLELVLAPQIASYKLAETERWLLKVDETGKVIEFGGFAEHKDAAVRLMQEHVQGFVSCLTIGNVDLVDVVVELADKASKSLWLQLAAEADNWPKSAEFVFNGDAQFDAEIMKMGDKLVVVMPTIPESANKVSVQEFLSGLFVSEFEERYELTGAAKVRRGVGKARDGALFLVDHIHENMPSPEEWAEFGRELRDEAQPIVTRVKDFFASIGATGPVRAGKKREG